MDNYLAVIFSSDRAAFVGLHKLWHLDSLCDVTMHGAVVIHRGADGDIDVATKVSHPAVPLAVGIGIGAFIGALAAPIRPSECVGEDAAYESSLVLRPGESAVIAEATEHWITPVNLAMANLGGIVFRRKKDIRDFSLFGPYDDYLYPYDYDPYFIEN